MFLRLSIRNLGKRKFRSFLIILSVALSVALLYTILSLSLTITDFYGDMISKTTGDTDILVSPKESQLLLENQRNEYQDEDVAFVVPMLDGFAYHMKDQVAEAILFHGVELDDMKTLYPQDFASSFSQEDEVAFTGHKVILGEYSAKLYDLKVGDRLKVVLAGKDLDFIVYRIEQDSNILASSSTMQNVMVPMETLKEILGVEDSVSNFYIGVKGEGSKEKEEVARELVKKWEEERKESNNESEFQLTRDSSALGEMLQVIQISLSLMTMSVLLVSAFIIFSTFKVIILERMSFIGTIRSLGATKKTARKVLFTEGLFYGIFGGLVGVLLGIGILKLTIGQIFQMANMDQMDFRLVYGQNIIISLFMAIALVGVSCLVPVLQIAKHSIRGLLFSEIKNTKHFSIVRSAIGAMMMISAFFLVNTSVKELRMPFSFLGILGVTVGGAFLIPTITMVLTFIVRGLMGLLLGQHGRAATTQIAHDKTLMNNIILMSMGLAVILMINNFSASVADLVKSAYDKGNADIMMMYHPFTQEFEDTVSQIEGVTHVYSTKHIFNVEANHGDILLPFLEGIDGKGYADYAWNEFGHIMTEDFERVFQGERSIIITTLTANNNDLKKGDTIQLKLGEKWIDYKVVAVVESLMNNGNMSYIYDGFLTEDTGIENASSMYINATGDLQKVIQSIKESSPLAMYPLITLEEMEERNTESNQSMFLLMKSISFIAMFIGSIGIFNNYVISFISRRKFMATLRSLGVSKMNLLKLFLSEAILSGLIGALSGIGIGVVLIEAMKYVLENMNMSSSLIGYSIREILFVAVSGLALGVVGAILPAISNVKRPIVPELKYE